MGGEGGFGARSGSLERLSKGSGMLGAVWVVEAVGVVWVVRAQGGPGTPVAALKDSLNTYKRLLGAVWVVGAVRARGGPGTHWQPLLPLETPTKGSIGMLGAVWVVGAVGVVWAVRARGVRARIGGLFYSLNTGTMLGAVCVLGTVGVVWAVRAQGGPGTHWQPLNTLQTPKKRSRNAGSGVGGGGGKGGAGGEGAAGPGTH